MSKRYVVDKLFHFTDDRFLSCREGETFTIVNKDVERERYACQFDHPGNEQVDFIVNKPNWTWWIPMQTVLKYCSQIDYDPTWEL